MKKLIFFFLLLSAVVVAWNCDNKKQSEANGKDSPLDLLKPSPPMRVVSLVDIALLAKIRSADPKKPDAELLREIYVLHRLDGELRSQINSINKAVHDSPKGQGSLYDNLVAKSIMMYAEPGCCACGTGCCNSCGGGDTTKANYTAAAVQEIKAVSLSAKSSAVMALHPVDSVRGVMIYNLDMKKPDGLYMLTLNTPLSAKPISVQVEIRNKKFMFPEFGKP